MEKKILIIIEVLIIVFLFSFYLVKEVIPEYKKSIGSSDKLISTSIYKNMVEFNIDNKVNFGVVISEDNKIYHLMFFNKEATFLYNKNIENNDVKNSLEKIFKLLIENNYLINTSNIKVIRYEDYFYNEFRSLFVNLLNKYNINSNFLEEKKTLKDKALELDLNDTRDEQILRNIDLYSKEFSRSLKNVYNNKNNEILSKENSKSFTNNVYKKLEKYVLDNNIKTIDKNSTELVINMIPADSEGKYYPSTNSWYYVDNGKIFAYIEIGDNNKYYGYCYNGSIDFIKEGEC